MSPSDSQPPGIVRASAPTYSYVFTPFGRSHEDLADLTRRQLVAVPVRTTFISPAMGRPTDPRCASHSTTRDDRRGLRLGTGVELPDRVGAEPLDPLLLQPRRARRGEVPHDLQRRDVVALAHLGRELRDARHHRRHHVHRVRMPAVDQLQRLLRVEATAEHDVIAREQRRDRPHERTVVVQRARHHVRAVDLHHQQRVELGIDEPGTAREDQLRPAGAAAGRHRLERIRRPRRATDRRRRLRRASNRRAGRHARDDPRDRRPR